MKEIYTTTYGHVFPVDDNTMVGSRYKTVYNMHAVSPYVVIYCVSNKIHFSEFCHSRDSAGGYETTRIHEIRPNIFGKVKIQYQMELRESK